MGALLLVLAICAPGGLELLTWARASRRRHHEPRALLLERGEPELTEALEPVTLRRPWSRPVATSMPGPGRPCSR